MAGGRRVVFGDRVASNRLPDWASGGVVLVEWLQGQGLWQEATERVKIQREGGYAGIDALLFFIYYFSSGLRVGVKEFVERAREHSGLLAAIGQRRKLATQSSMSRILAAVDADFVRGLGSWLLRVAGVVAVLRHPSVLTRDAEGEGWHVFDWDPTVDTLRHRALPVVEGTPEAHRRSESLVKPGYPGRKRGDVQFSRAMLQHAGSGLWLGIEMGPGNGALREAFHSAIRETVAICQEADIPLGRVILRMDGAGGNVPFITACAEAGVHYITRLAHYQLLQDPRIVEHLNQADWFDVPSSGAGPARQAADLGWVMLEAGANTRRADGSTYAPIEARVVVSRFRSREDGRGAGVVLNGWQYELWGTHLSRSAWPEAEIVAGYFGRSGQENRFSQEDRELGLGRIYSYHLPGQQLATLVGLLVWNFQVCRGMDLAHPPEVLPAQLLAERVPLTETPLLPQVAALGPEAADESGPTADLLPSAAQAVAEAEPSPEVVARHDSELEPSPQAADDDDSALEPNPQAGSSPRATRRAMNEARNEPVTSADLELSSAARAVPEEAPKSASSSSAGPTSLGSARHAVIEAFNEADWKRFLIHHEGWAWAAHKGGLLCPAKAVLPLVRVGEAKGQAVRVQFLAHPGACDVCTRRQACIRSDDPHYRKDLRLLVPSSQADSIRADWMAIPYAERGARSAPKPSSPARAPRPQPRAVWRLKSLQWQPPNPGPMPRCLAVAFAILLVAELRGLARDTIGPIEVQVDVELPPDRPKPCRVLAPTAAKRQRRRLSWDDRLAWNRLPDDAKVEIRFLGAGLVQGLLAPPRCAENLAKSA